MLPLERTPDEASLRVNDEVAIPRGELEFRATRAGGPGGQHVNTSSTRIELLWNVRRSAALTLEQRTHLEQHLASRLDGEGWLRIVARESRSQRQNRDRAEARLIEVVRQGLVVPKRRRPTKPSRAAKAARLEAKRKQSEKKRDRRWTDD